MTFHMPLLSAVLLSCGSLGHACDLCAISSASSAKGEAISGFSFTLSQQFIPYRTEYIEGEEVKVDYGSKGPDYLDKSITHLVPTWNFSDRFGVSLNVPLIYERYRRFNVLFTESPPTQVTFIWSLHFAAQTAVDLPLWITNNGWQSVPDYRKHGSLT